MGISPEWGPVPASDKVLDIDEEKGEFGDSFHDITDKSRISIEGETIYGPPINDFVADEEQLVIAPCGQSSDRSDIIISLAGSPLEAALLASVPLVPFRDTNPEDKSRDCAGAGTVRKYIRFKSSLCLPFYRGGLVIWKKICRSYYGDK